MPFRDINGKNIQFCSFVFLGLMAINIGFVKPILMANTNKSRLENFHALNSDSTTDIKPLMYS